MGEQNSPKIIHEIKFLQLPQPGWIWHQQGPVYLHLTAEMLHQSSLWCQPQRWLLLCHTHAMFSHVNFGSQFWDHAEMSAPVCGHLAVQASQPAPDQSLPIHLQVAICFPFELKSMVKFHFWKCKL